MKKQILLIFMSVLLAAAVLLWGGDRSWAQSANSNKELKRTEMKGTELKYRGGRLTTAERKEAAKRAKALGLKPGVAGRYAAVPAQK